MQLIADNLSVSRGSRRVIEGLSFSIASGEALILTGPNGSGKTTLIRTLAGLLAPEAGTVRLDGADAERSLGEQAHYVGHANGVKPALTVEENLVFWARYLGASGERAAAGARAKAALAAFDLAALAGIPAGFLSAGQRRRLGLARLFAAWRPIWLLDEPTVSLDAASTALLAQSLARHVAGGGLVVAATHLPLGLDGATFLRLGGADAA